jgi:hypothetical protein
MPAAPMAASTVTGRIAWRATSTIARHPVAVDAGLRIPKAGSRSQPGKSHHDAPAVKRATRASASQKDGAAKTVMPIAVSRRSGQRPRRAA